MHSTKTYLPDHRLFNTWRDTRFKRHLQ